jgi:hypothetical protein
MNCGRVQHSDGWQRYSPLCRCWCKRRKSLAISHPHWRRIEGAGRKPRRQTKSTNLRPLHISSAHWVFQNYSCRWNNLPRILTGFCVRKVPPVDVPFLETCPAEFQCASCVRTLALLRIRLLFCLGIPHLRAKPREDYKLHTM